MKIETIGNKFGFLTGMVLFITIFYFVLTLKFKWLSNYLSYYNFLYVSIIGYLSYLALQVVLTKWKK